MPWLFKPANSGHQVDRPSGHAVCLHQLERNIHG